MKVLGIICEYNPFHNGHLYHINMAKKLTGCDYVVCVMSGNFMQRGEPSLLNKWSRTKMALNNGVDVVIELPLPFSIASAPYFAMGGIKILDSLNMVSDFCFGAETPDVDTLKKLANIIAEEPCDYKIFLKDYLNLGYSYPKARELALIKYLDDSKVSTIMACPNNILGMEYLKALSLFKSNINTTILKRTNDYNSKGLFGSIVSSSGIRACFNDSNFDTNSLVNFMPESCVSLLLEDISLGIAPIFFKNFDDILISKLRCMSKEEISKINYVSEGFENRIKTFSDKCCDISNLVTSLHTKRFTDTRVRRILLNALFGITKNKFDEIGLPPYIRILGVNHNGKKLLPHIVSNASLPVLINSSDCLNLKDKTARQLFDLECLATNLYVLSYKNPNYKQSNLDLTHPLIIV